MEGLRTMAEAEADRTEAEEAEAEEAEGAVTEDAYADGVEPPAPMDEAAIRKAERAISDQRTRLAKILGDEMVAHDCPLCSALGYLPELPPPGTTLEAVQTEEGIALAITAAGHSPDLLQAPDKGPCPECDGMGEVITGAKTPQGAVWQCSKCQGNGWVVIARDNPTTVYVPPIGAPNPQGNAGNGAQIPADAWDRPFGHPHYGLPPSMVGVEG